MRQIPLSEAKPGMLLARYIMNGAGTILLAPDVTLTEEYLRKLTALGVSTIFVKDPDHPDIHTPEYLSIQTQQRALAVLDTTMKQIARGDTFAPDAVDSVASDIVEDLLMQKNLTIHLSGIMTHDDDTLAHSLNCSIYSAILARIAGFTIPQIKEVAAGALLHDVGKMFIEKIILNKPGRLTEEEYAVVKVHAEQGFKSLISRRGELSSLVAHMAWQHHERVNGQGYPRQLQGSEILPYAKILAITDVYEAITVNRPYRRAMAPDAIYDTIHSGLGNEFDAYLGELFLSKLAIYIAGMRVMLNTGETGIVAAVPEETPQRPVVRLIAHPDGSPYTPAREISLADHPKIQILATKTT
ncbi:HD-GYP domain-containing protein [Anaeroselena agilis]|uniref:HD-GYP domain-containing protein n=1 Tax=Anaeroselena agilis TaxID=3063788 RepID=A0ABU3NXH5_9FIRM|nr:HD-GYP domain-containing protein [Selenomonadales bacterium 4137-cl]